MIQRTLTYAYSNARIKVLKSRLVGKALMDEMIAADSVESVIRILNETVYSQEMVELSLQYSGASLVEFATSLHFSRTTKKVLRMSPRDCKDIARVIISKWDVHNIKMILLSKHMGRQPDEARRWLITAGNLTHEEIESILRQPTVQDTVNFIGTTAYGRAARGLLPDYDRTKDIDPLLAALDLSYLDLLSQAVKKNNDPKVDLLLMAEIDAKNIMTILRCKKDGSLTDDGIRALTVPAGNLSRQDINAIIQSKNVEEAVSKVKHYNLASPLEEYLRDGSLSHFERALERHLFDHAVKTFYGSVMSVAVIVGFLYIMEDEIRTIRRIVRAKEFNMPKEELFGIGLPSAV